MGAWSHELVYIEPFLGPLGHGMDSDTGGWGGGSADQQEGPTQLHKWRCRREHTNCPRRMKEGGEHRDMQKERFDDSAPGLSVGFFPMGYKTSLRNKAAHFVSDLTAVILNPISDVPSTHDETDHKAELSSEEQLPTEGTSEAEVDGPDTSSFAAFLYSLLSSPEQNNVSNEEISDFGTEMDPTPTVKEKSGRRSLIAFGKQSIKKAIYLASRVNGYRDQSILKDSDGRNEGFELSPIQVPEATLSRVTLPHMSEPSLLLSESTRRSLYISLPVLIRERKWILLYSTWRHGISLSTLYRRSMLLPGFSLLVVGDRTGAVFGGLIEAPLGSNNRKKYQGSSNTFVFSNRLSNLAIYRPTGANRYFTLCASDYLALGGGGHFALYLDGDLLNGSSSASETFGNACLANSQDFEVKEVELWGFAYGSKYEEVLLALSRTESPGICRW
ncbi:hypothetical protein H6P81_011497 [Aristolochia fimbriata]|uniref:Oxidation resistance protein 1 n=1 Tax=Aristolochia fimbriata TaxID=158543 RepID=A0AAV7EV74_ARIFI|nr:hypothetical protein H6P81_011497 [Aristolochia fimbriata]